MAGIIPPEIVEQVRHASDIVDVIGGYVPLKKSGAKFKAGPSVRRAVASPGVKT